MNHPRTKSLVLLALAFAGCGTMNSGGGGRVAAFISSPEGQALVGVAERAAASALTQAAGTGSVNQEQLVRDSIFGASAGLRRAQQPDANVSAAAARTVASTSIRTGSPSVVVDNTVAPRVAAAVANAVATGNVPADLALEAAARGLDRAALAHRTPSP